MLSIFIASATLVVGELLAAALTGRDKRGYSVLAADDTVTVAGQRMLVAALADQYRPVVRYDPAHVPPRVERIWYEVAARDEALVIVYYLDWTDEIHPSPVHHALYRLYRQAVYGSARDIEYLQVTVGTAHGDVQRVRFETAEPGPYERNLPTHYRAFLDLNADRTGYDVCIADSEAGCNPADVTLRAGVWDAENPVTLGVMTWNHLYTLLPPTDADAAGAAPASDYSGTVDAPLRALPDDVYREYKLARRSQGDLKTPPADLPRTALRVVFWGAGLLLAALVWWKGRGT